MKSMHLRHFRILFVLIAMCVLSDAWAGRAEADDSEGPGSGASGGSDRPNVVMIISDDQAWTDYGFMGHEHIRTPRLDELAAQSLTFTRGYVPTSLCRPSLATMISGLYPHHHGIVGNDPPWAGMDAGQRRPPHTAQPYLQSRIDYLRHIDAMTTLPDRLAPLGYRSLQTGKWWEGNFRRGGFDAGMTIGDMSRDGRHGDKGLAIGRQGIAEIDEFLDQSVNDHAPFFVWYAPFLPHTPHTPPQRLLDKYEPVAPSLSIAKYWAMCEWFDESCGAVLDSLQQRGLNDNTIVLYVCDNGWINRTDASRYAPRSKRSPNEGGIRTPIMVRWPGHVEPKMENDQMASSIDLVPTVLAAAGQDIPTELPGINLLDAAAVEGRNQLVGEIFDHDIRSQTDPAASLQYRWIIRDSMKLIDPSELMDDQSLQLYDLADDPHENHDLAAERPDLVESLSEALDQWWAPKTK